MIDVNNNNSKNTIERLGIWIMLNLQANIRMFHIYGYEVIKKWVKQANTQNLYNNKNKYPNF